MDIKQLKKDIENTFGAFDKLNNIFGDLKNARQTINKHFSEIERLTELVKIYKKSYELYQQGVGGIRIEMTINGIAEVGYPLSLPVMRFYTSLDTPTVDRSFTHTFQDFDLDYNKTQAIVKVLIDSFEKDIEKHQKRILELRELFKHSAEIFNKESDE